jgi:MoaA/NifB/PqqE/SkfB family radical SAM enzyme
MAMIMEQAQAVSLLWLELTGRCGLGCAHCYAGSGPGGSHGTMTGDDWRSVIAQAAGLGVGMVQFIGGEPTLHPQFGELLSHAIGAGLTVEVYSNLTHVRDSWWELFARPNVRLATSYYSDVAAEHDAITGRSGSHARTLANIRQAVALQIPIRAGIVVVRDRQRVAQARAELEAIGVTRVRTDPVRALGRAAVSAAPDASQLCGNCGRGVAAILPSGDVCPCVMSRWLIAGNVRRTPLADILAGPVMASAVAAIPVGVVAGDCPPDHCNPDLDGNDCRPAESPLLVISRPARGPHLDDCSPVTGGGCGPGADQCGPNRTHFGVIQ